MITEQQIKSYKEKGYLIIKNIIPVTTIKDLQKITDDFVKNIYKVYESNIFKGEPCLEARIVNNPIKIPYPPHLLLDQFMKIKKKF